MLERIAALIHLVAAICSLIAGQCRGDWPYDAVCAVHKPATGSGGSGTLVATTDTHALIITNRHVAGTSGTIQLRWPTEKESKSGRVLLASRQYDLAAIEAELPNIEPVDLAPFDPADGPFTACGFPSYSRKQLQIQTGNYLDHFGDSTRITAQHQPGMSGGAVFNSHGELCAVIWGRSKTNVGWSVPGEHVQAFLEQFAAQPTVWRARLRLGRQNDCPDGTCRRPIFQHRKTEPYDPNTAPKFRFRDRLKKNEPLPPIQHQPLPIPPAPAPKPIPKPTPRPIPQPTPSAEQIHIQKLTAEIAELKKSIYDLKEKSLLTPKPAPTTPIVRNPQALPRPKTITEPIYYEIRRTK
jgi:hypothetical protein